jgi:hypothetical protein
MSAASAWCQTSIRTRICMVLTSTVKVRYEKLHESETDNRPTEIVRVLTLVVCVCVCVCQWVRARTCVKSDILHTCTLVFILQNGNASKASGRDQSPNDGKSEAGRWLTRQTNPLPLASVPLSYQEHSPRRRRIHEVSAEYRDTNKDYTLIQTLRAMNNESSVAPQFCD